MRILRAAAVAAAIGLAGCVPQDRVIITPGTSPWAPPMQMPAKPADTARIVVFRHATPSRLLPVSQPRPMILLDNVVLGEASDDVLYIRDVAPGEHDVTMIIPTSAGGADPKIEIATRRATINAGGEWFLEAHLSYYNCSGSRPIRPYDTGVPAVTAGSLVISFASIAAAMATTSCQTNLQLRPKWPTFGHEEIYPLLAKTGAEPLMTVEAPDRQLPNSGLSSSSVERLIRNHFNDNAALYKPYMDKSGRGNLLFRDLVLLSESHNTGNAGYHVTVAIEYLHVDEETVAGLYVKRPLRYTLRREDGVLKIASWTDGN